MAHQFVSHHPAQLRTARQTYIPKAILAIQQGLKQAVHALLILQVGTDNANQSHANGKLGSSL